MLNGDWGGKEEQQKSTLRTVHDVVRHSATNEYRSEWLLAYADGSLMRIFDDTSSSGRKHKKNK